jgi:hypothetical protein
MSLTSRLRFRAPLKRASLFGVLAALSACDVPTELPIFDVRWVVTVDSTALGVDELLPSNVTVSGGNFDVAVTPVLLTQTLGSLCPACIAADGLTVPKLLFNLTYNQTGDLGTDVVSVELVSGSISLDIQNNLGFDPINPAAATFGTFRVTLFDTNASGRQLAQVIVDGATGGSIPAGFSQIPLTLAPGTVSSTIFAEIDVVSPAGDLVLINVLNGFDITVTVGTISVSSATVDVDGLSVSIDQSDLDVGDIDTSVVERVVSGSLILDIQNPFGVGVNISLDISGPFFTTIQKNVTITNATTSSVTITYTGAELRSFLGQTTVQITGVGTVVASTPATVAPGQEVVIEATLNINLEIGG